MGSKGLCCLVQEVKPQVYGSTHGRGSEFGGYKAPCLLPDLSPCRHSKLSHNIVLCYVLAHSQDIGVGKSSLVGRFVHDSFNPNLTTTLGYVNVSVLVLLLRTQVIA